MKISHPHYCLFDFYSRFASVLQKTVYCPGDLEWFTVFSAQRQNTLDGGHSINQSTQKEFFQKTKVQLGGLLLELLESVPGPWEL